MWYQVVVLSPCKIHYNRSPYALPLFLDPIVIQKQKTTCIVFIWSSITCPNLTHWLHSVLELIKNTTSFVTYDCLLWFKNPFLLVELSCIFSNYTYLDLSSNLPPPYWSRYAMQLSPMILKSTEQFSRFANCRDQLTWLCSLILLHSTAHFETQIVRCDIQLWKILYVNIASF